MTRLFHLAALAAAAAAQFGSSGPHFNLFRIVLSSAPFHSGATIETCTPANGGPLTEACSGGLASADLLGRRIVDGLELWTPYSDALFPPFSPLEDQAVIKSPVLVPFLSNAPVLGILGGNWSPWCPVLKEADAPVALFTGASATALRLFDCPTVTVVEAADMSASEKVTADTSFTRPHFVDPVTGLVIVWSSFFGQGVDGATLAGKTDAAIRAARAQNPSFKDPPAVLLVEAPTLAALQQMAEDLAAVDSELSLLAIVSTTGDYLPTPTYFAPGEVLLATVPVSTDPDLVAVLDLVQPLRSVSSWTTNKLGNSYYRFDLQVKTGSLSSVTLDDRKASSRWQAIQAAADPAYALFDAANPVVGAIGAPIVATGFTEPGGCGFDDCAMGQFLAAVLATAPATIPGRDEDLGGGPAAGRSASGVPAGATSDPAAPAKVAVDIAFAHGGLHGGAGLPTATMRQADFDGRFGADTCRGRLRGLTVLRLLQASLAKAAGTAAFLQYDGLSMAFVPAGTAANLSTPVLVRAEVRDRATGRFAPLNRTQLYSVAMTRAMQELPAFAPILDAPLLDDSVSCFPAGTANLRALVRAHVRARTPVNFTSTDLIGKAAPSDVAGAMLAAGGLAGPETAAACADRNAAGADGLVFDHGLQSCIPCIPPLVPDAAAETCVAPPAPVAVDSTPLFASLGGVVLLLVGAVAAALLLWPVWRRRHCPADAAQPFTVLYVSTLNEAALRERHPDGVTKALRLVERTVAREAAAAGCVVARRLDAHHMVVAKDPARALCCAAAVLRALHATAWAPVLLTAADAERRQRITATLHQRGRRGSTESVSSRVSASASRSMDVSQSQSQRRTASESVDELARALPRGPEVAAGLWHGYGTVEREDGSGEAFGFRYGGAVAACAAAAAMAARPWEVALPSAARLAAEESLWARAGGQPEDLGDELDDVVADADLWCDGALRSSDGRSGGRSGGGSATAPGGDGPVYRLAPPQLGRGVFAPIGRLATVSAATLAEASQWVAAPDPGSLEGLLLPALRSNKRRDDASSGEAMSAISSSWSERKGRFADDAAGGGRVGNALAAALCAASGRLAAQRVGVVCVYVPAMRCALSGVNAATARALFNSGAPESCATSTAPDDIVAAAVGAAAHSRLVALLDGCMYFAINAPDVTTAQVPVRAAQEALTVTSAVATTTGALVAAGVAVGPSFVGAGQATLAEREGALKARPPPVAVLGTAADRACTLARMALPRTAGHSWHEVNVPMSSVSTPSSALVVDEDQDDTQPPVLVAGDMAVELSSFELQVVDLVAWPDCVSCLMPRLRAPHPAAFTTADIRRRVALAVRVVRDQTDAAPHDGDGEWLYHVGAVGNQSAFSATNTAAAALVRPLGVIADFSADVAVDSPTSVLPDVFAGLQEAFVAAKAMKDDPRACLATFASQRVHVANYDWMPFC